MKFDRSLMKTFLRYIFEHKTFVTKEATQVADFNTTSVKLSDFIKSNSEADIEAIKSIIYLLQHAQYIKVGNDSKTNEITILEFTEKGIDLLLKEIL